MLFDVVVGVVVVPLVGCFFGIETSKQRREIGVGKCLQKREAY